VSEGLTECAPETDLIYSQKSEEEWQSRMNYAIVGVAPGAGSIASPTTK
jgi:hypothetical protein